MKNLAGDQQCDAEIREELTAAGIEVVPIQKGNTEVPYSVVGQLGNFTFKRAWYYWMVGGDVPLEIAKEMYTTEVGKKDVRVAGHCGCPPPEEWAFPKREVLVELGIFQEPCEEHPHGNSPTYGELAKMCNSGKITAPRFVQSYHIDSPEGLKLFADTMKKHKLV